MYKIKHPSLEETINLLKKNKLPYSDIKEDNLKNFFGYFDNDSLEAIVGLEIYDDVALLRSLAVGDKKSSGVGSKLLKFINDFALKNGINSLYLLTTTASTYFIKKGFNIVNKDEAPSCIKNTVEFSSICPASSVFMKKSLT